jgi:hypothetical protein
MLNPLRMSDDPDSVVAGRRRRPARLAAIGAAVLAAVLSLTVLPSGVARAHHLGTYTPRDNEISANFKEIKSAVEARRFDVARRLFDEGAVRREMREQAARLPPGLERATQAGLGAGDTQAVETALMVFLAALARNLALDAQQQVSASGVGAEARMAAARLFLEAIWRYYNLVDYAAARRAPKISVAVRLAFDDAEGLTKGTAVPVAASPPSPRTGAAAAPAVDPLKLREPLQRIAQALGALIEISTPRAGSHSRFGTGRES